MDDKPYAKGSYNKTNETEQWIRITEGCPNNCEFCRETRENGRVSQSLPIPEFVRNIIKIMDMNFIVKSDILRCIKWLGEQRINGKVIRYELICGVDYRNLTQEIADALKQARFLNIRLAWDFGFSQQLRIKTAIGMLIKAGYSPKELSVLMICNWKIPLKENMRKLDLLKVWGVKVNDCWFDNQLSPNIKPIFWNDEDIKLFRKACRKHNQLVLFGIDPEYRPEEGMKA